VIPDVKAHTLRQAVMDHIDLSARLMTDEASAYKKLGKEFAAHDQIQHKNNIYVRGDISTNTIESFWALLKRGITGIYHNVSRKHLQRYLDEFEFRYNHRKMEDGERVLAVIRTGDGGLTQMVR
jgi:transposase-like protein